MRRVVGRLLFGTAMAVSAGTLALTLLVHVSGVHWLVDPVSGWRPQYLWLGSATLVMGLATALIVRQGHARWLPVILSALCVVLNGIALAPFAFASRPRAVGPHAEIRLMEFNVLGSSTAFRDVVALARRETPDVALFLEADGRWPVELAALTNSLPYRVRVSEMDIDCYSRYPLREVERRYFGARRGFVVLSVTLEGSSFVLLACHTCPARAFGVDGYRQRNVQLREGIPAAVARQTEPVVVLGDLNVDPWSTHYATMKRRSGLWDARLGFGAVPTCNPRGPRWGHRLLGRAIDHCLVSPGIGVRDIRTGPRTGSDHLPVLAQLEIPERAESL